MTTTATHPSPAGLGAEEALARQLERAERSPFYAGRLGHASEPPLERLARLPLTTKQDLRDAYPWGLLAVDRSELATYHESSGTAGQPTASYYTAEDWVDLAERYSRKRVPIGPDDTFLVRTPYALMITGHLAHAAARSRGATVVPGDNRSVAMPFSRVIRVLHDLQVSLTWSMPTEPLLWHRAARLAGRDPLRDFPALRALFVGGEPLTPARRRRTEELWGVPVVEEYGATEVGSLAGTCEEGKLHLWTDRVHFEVHDPATGRCCPVGRGTLVATPLQRAAMPLLRYDLGDTVEVDDGACPCGSTQPTVRVLGRAAFGHRVQGRPVTQHQLEEVVFGLPAAYDALFWRAQANPAGDPDRLVVELEAAPAHAREAAARVHDGILRDLGVRAEVSVLPPGALVPDEVLVRDVDVSKPRFLFGPDEDWATGIIYY